MTAWLPFIVAAAWWALCEYIRGRPSVSGTLNLVLQLLGPMVFIIVCVMTIILRRVS